LRIAELEQRTGVSRYTLRYYEKQGLLTEVSRAGNNYRDYSEHAVKRIIMVRQLKSLGFSLAEIRALMNAVRSDTINCRDGALLMAEKRETVELRIRELQDVRELLLQEQKRLEESARLHGQS